MPVKEENPVPEQIGFYVTMLRGEKVAWLAGPLPSKEAAEAMVNRAYQEACRADPRSAFDAFGVTKVSRPDGEKPLPPGVLNDRLAMQKVT